MPLSPLRGLRTRPREDESREREGVRRDECVGPGGPKSWCLLLSRSGGGRGAGGGVGPGRKPVAPVAELTGKLRSQVWHLSGSLKEGAGAACPSWGGCRVRGEVLCPPRAQVGTHVAGSNSCSNLWFLVSGSGRRETESRGEGHNTPPPSCGLPRAPSVVVRSRKV